MDVKDDEIPENISNKKQIRKKEKISKMSDIIDSDFKPDEGNKLGAPSTQSKSVITNETYNQALEKFNAKDFSSAKQLFEVILINDNCNYNALYYKSLCFFNLDDYDNAISGFNQVLKIKKGEFFDSAKWYKALALIKKGNKKEAKKILEEIIKSNSLYKNDAEQKLKEI